MASKLGPVAAMGALGGAVNAALCYLQLPAHAGEQPLEFSAAIIPAGAAHGGVLAVVAAAGWQWLGERPAARRWAGLAGLGWVAGWLSFIPINWYIASVDVGGGLLQGAFSGLTLKKLLGGVIWPFKQISGPEPLTMPFVYFGLVAVAYGLLSWAASRGGRAGRGVTLAVWCASGVLGSLWWWIDWRPWYFSLIHGPLWGVLVGTGVWYAEQPSRAASR